MTGTVHRSRSLCDRRDGDNSIPLTNTLSRASAGLRSVSRRHSTAQRDRNRPLDDIEPGKNEQMLEDIRLRVVELRRRVALMDLEDEEIETEIVRLRGLVAKGALA